MLAAAAPLRCRASQIYRVSEEVYSGGRGKEWGLDVAMVTVFKEGVCVCVREFLCAYLCVWMLVCEYVCICACMLI